MKMKKKTHEEMKNSKKGIKVKEIKRIIMWRLATDGAIGTDSYFE